MQSGERSVGGLQTVTSNCIRDVTHSNYTPHVDCGGLLLSDLGNPYITWHLRNLLTWEFPMSQSLMVECPTESGIVSDKKNVMAILIVLIFALCSVNPILMLSHATERTEYSGTVQQCRFRLEPTYLNLAGRHEARIWLLLGITARLIDCLISWIDSIKYWQNHLWPVWNKITKTLIMNVSWCLVWYFLSANTKILSPNYLTFAMNDVWIYVRWLPRYAGSVKDKKMCMCICDTLFMLGSQ